jgi:hypothetical protein
VARSFRQIPAVAALAAACVLAWPVAARADSTILSSASGLLGPVLAVPAATLPAIPAQLLPAAGPDRPHPSTATPQAYIKNRVEVRVYRGTVLAVGTSANRLVVAIRYRSMGRTIKRRQVFSVGAARLRVDDANGDGSKSLDDIERGDRVRVRAVVEQGPHKSSTALTARSVVDSGPQVYTKRRGRRIR